MQELRTFVGRFVIVALLIISLPALLRRLGVVGTSGVLLAFVLIGAIAFYCESLILRARRQSIEKAARLFGFYPGDAADLGLAIRKTGTMRSIVRGQMRGIETWLFDYSISEGEDSLEQTVAAFVVADDNLPIFELCPRGFSGRVEAVSFDDYYFEYVRFEDMPSFENRFPLKSSAVEHVRRYFKRELLETLLHLEDCKCMVEGYFTTVVCFTPGVKIPSKELETFARRCSNVAYALFASGKAPHLV